MPLADARGAALPCDSNSWASHAYLRATPPPSSVVAAKSKKRDVVQVKNPRTGHYVKIDRAQGRILDHKKSEGPYKNVPIARKRKAA